MTPTILYYTHALLPKPLLQRTLREASEAAEAIGGELMVVSHVPLFEDTAAIQDGASAFGPHAWGSTDPRFRRFLDTVGPCHKPKANERNIVTGILKYSPEAILEQIRYGISHSSPETDCVLLWEHDVLYPCGYAETMCETLEETGAEFVIYHDHLFLDDEGYFKPETHFWHLSRYGALKQRLALHMGYKVATGEMSVLEPVPKGMGNGDEAPCDIVDSFAITGGNPVLDIRHGANASGQILVDEHSDRHPYWGKLKKNRLLELLDDPDYDEFLQSKPMIGYGLFTIKSSEVW
jgi:hypothetical protein